MATVGIKRFTLDNKNIQIKTGTTEYLPSSAEKTPVLDDGSGNVMFHTQEKKAGMIKVEVSTLKATDNTKLRNIDGAEIILELIDGTTVVGTNMTQSGNNSITVADGIFAAEFTGDVVER